MDELINVPYCHQKANGYCLPACAQMALAYLGIKRSQEELARTLGMLQDFGTPASHLLKLRSRHIQVEYKIEGNFGELRNWLERGFPVIAFVYTGLLTYWKGQTAQHAILIVGINENVLYILDPAKTETTIAVPISEFNLAWDEMEFAFAVLTS